MITQLLRRNGSLSTTLVVVAKMEDPEKSHPDAANLDRADSLWARPRHLWSSHCLPPIGQCASLQL